jgi:hypothetical protein
MSGSGTGGSGTSVRAVDRRRLPGDGRGGRRAVGLGMAAQAPAGQLDPDQLADQVGAGGERHRRGGPGAHLGQPRRHRLAGHAQLAVPGRQGRSDTRPGSR